MGTFAVGDIVVVSFPFSDLTSAKKRPALVVGQADFGNLILCQITSKAYASNKAIALTALESGGALPLTSYIRPDKLFTADTSIILSLLGSVSQRSIDKVKTELKSIFELS